MQRSFEFDHLSINPAKVSSFCNLLKLVSLIYYHRIVFPTKTTKITINHLSPLPSSHSNHIILRTNKTLIPIFFKRKEREKRKRAIEQKPSPTTNFSNPEKFQFIFPTTKHHHTRVLSFFTIQSEQRLFEVITDIWHRFPGAVSLSAAIFHPAFRSRIRQINLPFFIGVPLSSREKLRVREDPAGSPRFPPNFSTILASR